MGYVPHPPRGRLLPKPPQQEPRMWKCTCDGCGAPLQRDDLQCSYCLRATLVLAHQIEVTTIESPAAQLVVGIPQPPGHFL